MASPGVVEIMDRFQKVKYFGKQILVEDPSGNPVELFEPTIPEARL